METNQVNQMDELYKISAKTSDDLAFAAGMISVQSERLDAMEARLKEAEATIRYFQEKEKEVEAQASTKVSTFVERHAKVLALGAIAGTLVVAGTLRYYTMKGDSTEEGLDD